jgi:hypothetical protein
LLGAYFVAIEHVNSIPEPRLEIRLGKRREERLDSLSPPSVVWSDPEHSKTKSQSFLFNAYGIVDVEVDSECGRVFRRRRNVTLPNSAEVALLIYYAPELDTIDSKPGINVQPWAKRGRVDPDVMTF